MSELKDNVLNLLEEKGIINNFKSELRAQVRKAMSEFLDKKNVLEKPEVLQQLQTPEMQLCLEVIWEFLEYIKLKNSLEVFVPECNLKGKPRRYDLENRIGIKADPTKPILLKVIEKCKKLEKSDQSAENSIEIPNNKFFDKVSSKVPEISLNPKPKEPQIFEKKVPVTSTPLEPSKLPEKPSNPLTTLPKPTDKTNDRLKLQPLTALKKNINLRSFDVLSGDDKFGKAENEEKKSVSPPKYEETPSESIDEEIEDEVEVEEDHKDFYESQATSSMGVDASVNSLALEEFDHIENIRPPKKR